MLKNPFVGFASPFFCRQVANFRHKKTLQQTPLDKPYTTPKSSSLAEGQQEFHLHTPGLRGLKPSPLFEVSK